MLDLAYLSRSANLAQRLQAAALGGTQCLSLWKSDCGKNKVCTLMLIKVQTLDMYPKYVLK